MYIIWFNRKNQRKPQGRINKFKRLITYKLSVQQLMKIDPNMNHMMKQDHICFHTNQLKQQLLLIVVRVKNIAQREISMTAICKTIHKNKVYYACIGNKGI